MSTDIQNVSANFQNDDEEDKDPYKINGSDLAPSFGNLKNVFKSNKILPV